MKPTILCLNCHQFDRDLRVLQAQNTRYEYLIINDTVFMRDQLWIPEHMREQSSYVNFQGPEIDALWEQSRRYGVKVIEDARKNGANIVAVLAANWDYWNDECMRLACDELGLPFLVLLRESYQSTLGLKENRDYFSQWSRIPQPDAIAMAGPATVNLFKELNLFPKAPLIPTGWPRLDIWREPATPMLDRPVVLMSYFKGYNAEQHFVDMLPIFNDMAKQHPTVPFKVKAKHIHEAGQINAIVQKRGLSNIQVIDTLKLPSLLCNARAVIGFNSMIMFESLLSPSQLILPYWGETAQDPEVIAPSPEDPRVEEHMIFVTSESMLRQMVDWAIAGRLPPADMDGRIKAFGEFFTYTREQSSVERVEDFIDESLRSYASRRKSEK